MVSKSKKILVASVALSFFATAYGGGNSQTTSRDDAKNSYTVQQTIPKQPKKGWKISAKDYAELVDDCGDSGDSGREGRASSRGDTTHR